MKAFFFLSPEGQEEKDDDPQLENELSFVMWVRWKKNLPSYAFSWKGRRIRIRGTCFSGDKKGQVLHFSPLRSLTQVLDDAEREAFLLVFYINHFIAAAGRLNNTGCK